MKILILSITFLFLVLFPSMAQEPRLSDELVFEERVFDFGEIKEEDGLVSQECQSESSFYQWGNEWLWLCTV